MSQAIIGLKTQMQIEDSSNLETFLTIAEVLSITALSLSTESVDVTNMDSPDKFMEFIPGLRDSGEVSFDINYIFGNATHGSSTGILQDFENVETTARNWKIVFPDVGATTWSFAGFVTGFTLNDPVDTTVTASITIKVTGKPTFA